MSRPARRAAGHVPASTPDSGAPRRAQVPAADQDRGRGRPVGALRVGLLVGSLTLVTTAVVAAAPDLVAGRLTENPVPAAASIDPTAEPGDAEPGFAGPGTAEPATTEPAERPVADRPDRALARPELPTTPSPAPVVPAPPPAPPPPPVSVAGIPDPCPIDVPITASMDAATIAERAERQWGFTLTGPQWRDNSYRPVVKLFAETLDAVDCTDYLNRVKAGNGGSLEVSSRSTNSWAWGDYGLSRAGVLTLDLAKFKQGYAEGDRGRLVRLIIHEMAHSLNADRDSQPAYWQRYQQVWASNGPVSAYGSNQTESFADAVGYYVARCAADNPYASTKHRAYYEYVKANIFGGREFGGAVGTRQSCDGEGR